MSLQSSLLTDLIALITIIVWPVVPLFWIPVHCATGFFRKIRLLTYIMPLVTWLPLAYFIYYYRDFILQFKIVLPAAVTVIGILFLAFGTSLHIWTGKLLGLRGLIGLPEIEPEEGGRLVTEGPFSVVRHPTYLAHTMMFLGVFLITGMAAVGIITILDIVVINSLVIPLEEKELLIRFGDEYERYKGKVPGFFPQLFG